jgi:uncharacterized caspase-like protein
MAKSIFSAVVLLGLFVGAIGQQASAGGLFPESLRRFDTKDNPAVERRELKVVALIIGISAYSFGPLRNPAKDASAVAEKLKSYGYETELLLDPNKDAIQRAAGRFQELSRKSDAAIFYYAGHGLQLNGINYIVPADFSPDIDNNDSVRSSLISINELIAVYMASRIKLVLLDACRNNPFSGEHIEGGRSLVSPMLRRLTLISGLAPIPVAETSDTLISFATKDGRTANDGDGIHSPYTEALLKHIDEKVDVSLLLRRIRIDVMKQTNNEQQPWDYGSLRTDELVISR